MLFAWTFSCGGKEVDRKQGEAQGVEHIQSIHRYMHTLRAMGVLGVDGRDRRLLTDTPAGRSLQGACLMSRYKEAREGV